MEVVDEEKVGEVTENSRSNDERREKVTKPLGENKSEIVERPKIIRVVCLDSERSGLDLVFPSARPATSLTAPRPQPSTATWSGPDCSSPWQVTTFSARYYRKSRFFLILKFKFQSASSVMPSVPSPCNASIHFDCGRGRIRCTPLDWICDKAPDCENGMVS